MWLLTCWKVRRKKLPKAGRAQAATGAVCTEEHLAAQSVMPSGMSRVNMVQVKDEEGRTVSIPYNDFWKAANANEEPRKGKGWHGSPRRGRSKKKSRSRDRRRERSRSPGWGERSGANLTQESGDWQSRSSGQKKGKKGEGGDRHHTYKRGKGEEFMNSYLEINREVGSAPESLSGDWLCPNCGDHQFAQNKECRMCNAPRDRKSVV